MGDVCVRPYGRLEPQGAGLVVEHLADELLACWFIWMDGVVRSMIFLMTQTHIHTTRTKPFLPAHPLPRVIDIKKAGIRRKDLPLYMGDVVVKPRGKPVLAPAHDRREEIVIGDGDVFDDLDADDDL